MSVAPLTGPIGLPAAAGPANLPPVLPGLSALPSAEDFGRMMSDYMQQASDMQTKLGTDIEALASGKSDNIQDVVLSAAQADLAFRMVIEIRNRIVSTYQEIMRMQI
jgi:flagellar hook-basal body complex protein FliE